MEGRKEKNNTLKNVLHYVFIAICVIGAIIAYIYQNNIADFFAQDLSGVVAINDVLHQFPTIINSMQIVVLAIVLNFVFKIILKCSMLLTDKGKTLLNIVQSLIKWIIIIASVLWILSIWGVNTETLIASAGILALVIGLGAQSLIADVLAGIFIVLEGEYVVGDIVVIDGWRGKITNVGIRTTQLEDIGGNVKIINNSEIKSVINRTKQKSIALCLIDVSLDLSLEKVEKTFLEALPEIKKSIPEIIDDIEYRGVDSIESSSMKLLFAAKCYEEDLFSVQRKLNRELKLLCDKNNIENFAPQAIVKQK